MRKGLWLIRERFAEPALSVSDKQRENGFKVLRAYLILSPIQAHCKFLLTTMVYPEQSAGFQPKEAQGS